MIAAAMGTVTTAIVTEATATVGKSDTETKNVMETAIVTVTGRGIEIVAVAVAAAIATAVTATAVTVTAVTETEAGGKEMIGGVKGMGIEGMIALRSLKHPNVERAGGTTEQENMRRIVRANTCHMTSLSVLAESSAYQKQAQADRVDFG